MVKPITPREAAASAGDGIPDFVVAAFNALIKLHWSPSSRSATFRQEEVVIKIQDAKAPGEIFRAEWLNVEGLYERVGWEVSYSKPGYNESGSATFAFGERGK